MGNQNLTAKPTPMKNVIRNVILRDLDYSKQKLEQCINATATGEKRNRLCDANIHITAAINILEGLLL